MVDIGGILSGFVTVFQPAILPYLIIGFFVGLFFGVVPGLTATLAIALLDLYNASNPIKVIGTRHGEKMFETLVTREEMAKSEDCGYYYRIPADTRDLNYGKFFTEGVEKVSQENDYTSHNTTRLDTEGMKELLLQILSSLVR